MPQKRTATKKISKPRPKKEPEKEQKTAAIAKPQVYYEAVGSRKTSVARVRIFAKGEEISVNGKKVEQYFPTAELKEIVFSPFKRAGLENFGASIKVQGGGIHSQAEAVRHGIAKALLVFSPDLRRQLKTAGFLTRDARMRERKKFGLKRARRAPQWQKR